MGGCIFHVILNQRPNSFIKLTRLFEDCSCCQGQSNLYYLDDNLIPFHLPSASNIRFFKNSELRNSLSSVWLNHG